MVSGILIAVLLVTGAPVWGGEVRQLCLTCHSAHYEERGRCNVCHLGNPASARKNVAHAGLRAGKYTRFVFGDVVEIKKSERMLDQFACRRCHVSNGRGNRLATNLDSAAKQRTAGELAISIRHPVANMPNFGLNEEQSTVLVNVILGGSQGQKNEVGRPVTVHFNALNNKKVDVFTRVCGSCHRLLSERMGALGTGNIGPNLSGILTAYYPKTFGAGQVWTFNNLKTWLINPRKVKPWVQMRPVRLSDAELKELESALRVQ